jgi:excisionase family DNA binding protein
MPANDTLTTPAAAALLGLDASRIRQLVRRGLLEATGRADGGRAYLVTRASVEAYQTNPTRKHGSGKRKG